MNSAECVSPLSGDLGSNDDIYRLHARKKMTRKIVRRRNLPNCDFCHPKICKGRIQNQNMVPFAVIFSVRLGEPKIWFPILFP